MAVLDLFSKRQKRLRGEVPDVYVYDELPERLRVQIIQIWTEGVSAVTQRHPEFAEHLYEDWVRLLRRKRGTFRLAESRRSSAPLELANYFAAESDTEAALDVVELVFQFFKNEATAAAQEHIDELNQRFREHGIGYQFEAGQVVRVDSQVLHADAVKPTLHLLSQPGFEGPEQEFLTAHEHHRHGRNKECLVECLKAFESTMKVICGSRGWTASKTAAAKELIAVCFQKGLIPTWMETEFASLRALLESSVPTARNKTAGHGQGSTVQPVPAHLAAYGLHMTASTILFLVEADKALGP